MTVERRVAVTCSSLTFADNTLMHLIARYTVERTASREQGHITVPIKAHNFPNRSTYAATDRSLSAILTLLNIRAWGPAPSLLAHLSSAAEAASASVSSLATIA